MEIALKELKDWFQFFLSRDYFGISKSKGIE